MTSSADAASSPRHPETTRESRNIVICSDGSGNVGGRFNGTNVWRSDVLFGFSRSAYTIRTRAYIADRCDDNGNLHTPEKIQELAHKAVNVYKFRHAGDDERFRLKYGGHRGLGGDGAQEPSEDEIVRFPIEFIGVGDTVATVGVPFRNVPQVLFWCWRKVTSFRLLRWARYSLLNFHRPTGNENQPGAWRAWEDDDLHPRVRYAFHAISIDDKRQPFYSLLWLDFGRFTGMRKAVSDREHVSLTARQREALVWEPRNVQQVWFAGMHS